MVMWHGPSRQETANPTEQRMGLSTNEIAFLAAALEADLLPAGGDVLEFGESEVTPEGSGPYLLETLAALVPAERMAKAAQRMLAAMESPTNYQRDFGPARALYHAVFEPASYVAVDLDPGPRKYCLDLNRPMSLGRRFDRVINNGTSEHLFDQANFFRVIHRHTKVGGLMIHWTPCLGWIDHGFYNVQPSFFFDLAYANAYAVRLIGLAAQGHFVPLPVPGALGDVLEANPALGDSMVCAILEKTQDRPFAVPNQGVFPFPDETVEAARRQHVVPAAPSPNLALGRPALQSSTSQWSWDSDPAVDASGAVNGLVTGAHGFHTDDDDAPWWQVDLGAARTLGEAVVYNCLENPDIAARSAHLAVSLSDDGQSWRMIFRRSEDTPFGGADGKPLRVPLGGESARFLRVSLPEGGYLHLDQVEVYGPALPG